MQKQTEVIAEKAKQLVFDIFCELAKETLPERAFDKLQEHPEFQLILGKVLPFANQIVAETREEDTKICERYFGSEEIADEIRSKIQL